MNNTIVRLALSDQIYSCLKEDILKENIKPGDRLTNRELQERFSVSSTPVRDAINKLYQEGLIKEVTNAGARIITFDREFAKAANDFIGALSALAVEFSFKNADRKTVSKYLHKRMSEMEKCNKSDYIEADFRFHMTFYDYCENPMLVDSYKKYNLVWRLLVSNAFKKYDTTSITISQHRAITNAYENGDVEEAMKLMREHYEYGNSIINKIEH